METNKDKATGEGETMTVTIGTEIFNTGDRANHEHFGIVTDVKTNKWGTHVTIQEIDDPAHTYVIEADAIGDVYSGNCSTRFVTQEAYKAWRKEQFKASFGEWREKRMASDAASGISYSKESEIVLGKQHRVECL